MSESFARENVDQLIDHFWQNGYLTLSRKYGTYLPAPNPIGNYSVDVVGRYNKKFAIGIILYNEDFENERIVLKLAYLATRQTKYSNKKVTLFVGVYKDNLTRIKEIINNLDDEVRKNIKLVTLEEKNTPVEIINSRRNHFISSRYAA